MSIWSDLIGGLGAAGGGYAQALEKVKRQDLTDKAQRDEQQYREDESTRRHNEYMSRVEADKVAAGLTATERSAQGAHRTEMQRLAGVRASDEAAEHGRAAEERTDARKWRQEQTRLTAAARGDPPLDEADRGTVTALIARVRADGGTIEDAETQLNNQYASDARYVSIMKAFHVVTGEMAAEEYTASLKPTPGAFSYDEEGRPVLGATDDTFFGGGGTPTPVPVPSAPGVPGVQVPALPEIPFQAGRPSPGAMDVMNQGGAVTGTVPRLRGSTPPLRTPVAQADLGIPPLPGAEQDPFLEYMRRQRGQIGP